MAKPPFPITDRELIRLAFLCNAIELRPDEGWIANDITRRIGELDLDETPDGLPCIGSDRQREGLRYIIADRIYATAAPNRRQPSTEKEPSK
jgi:hypothetical protein